LRAGLRKSEDLDFHSTADSCHHPLRLVIVAK
jgi:hypothetical protein